MLDEYQDLIDELLQTPSIFRDLLASGASPEEIALIAQLRDRDRAVLDRLQRMTRETSPHLKALPPLAETPPPDTEPAAEILTGMETARGDLISLLMNLSLKDWRRTATHEDGGIISLADEVEAHVEIDESIVARIRATS